MSEYNYEKVYSLFPECEKFMREEQIFFNNNWETYCEEFEDNYSDILAPSVSNICSKSIEYLFQIFTSTENSSLKNVAVQYLYYWINQKKQTNEEDNTGINKFYEKLILNAKEKDIEFLKHYNNYLKYNIEDLEIINDLYNIKTLINNISSNSRNPTGNEKNFAKECEKRYNRLYKICENTHNADLCDEFKNIRKKLRDHNIINKYHISIPEMLSYLEKQNIIVPILIPIVITLLFTPHGSYLKYAVKSIRNKFKNTYKKLDTMHSYENYDNNSWKRGYDVLYNSA
ncbi:variable surface protein [Plasmodium gonderi]|uniref:Variable surface protein n=1 Tax=Plasmodium gonderi TaxID=77519 RepID=A0A1Y1JNR4_PLAGO|nr:variable surface protein [Plasmodium gonderi]GAW84109.1 variable surface protein [Plasmodium gonderi]